MEAGSSKKGVKSDINVTPLVDVVLVLLIIFMVLTPSTLKHLSALVPKKSEDSTPPPTDSVIVVEYSADRTVTVNTEPVTAESLGEKLTTRLKAARQKVIFFKADDAAPYGDVVRLMDIARGAGAESLAVVTRAP